MDGADRPVPRIDRPILEDVRDRLRTASQFETVVVRTTEGQLRLEAVFASIVNQPSLVERSLDVRWYTNDDFRIHYREVWDDRSWAMRWDRHPNSHNDRDHVHPPPDASTPGADRTWPSDYRDVLALVLDAIRDRSEELWNRSE